MTKSGILGCLIVVATGWSCAAFAADKPASSAPESLVILDRCDYANVESARKNWKPAERDTPPVERAVVGGEVRVLLPTNFKTNSEWRVAWDRVGQWDLSACQTIRVHVSTEGDQPAGMILYLRSGDGWYASHFAGVPGEGIVDLPRKKFSSEGKPGGWDRIDCIRVSVLREDGPARTLALSGLEGVARPAHVAVYRNGAGVKSESGVPQFVRQMCDALDRLSIAYEIVGDEEVAAGKLAGKKVAILPINPVLPKESGAALEKFVADGGKLIVCYCLPEPLEKLLGVKSVGTLKGDGADAGRLRHILFRLNVSCRPIISIQNSWIAHRIAATQGTEVRGFWNGKDDDPWTEPAATSNAAGFFIGHVLTPVDQENKDEMILEMIGELWPGMWECVYQTRLASFGRFAGFKDAKAVAESARKNLNQIGNEKALRDFDANCKHLVWDTARQPEGKSDPYDFRGLVIALGYANNSLLYLYAATVPSKPNEFRAVWCHSSAGVADMTWDESIKRLADSGFNALIVNMCWGGSAAYESKVLPRERGVVGDRLAECLAAGKKHGVAVHVWRVNWNLGWNVDPKHKADLRAAGRLQEDPAGKPIDWLCPSNPENQKLELDSMLEIAANYDVAGLHFDYIRYPDEHGCFCPGCRQRFETRENLKVGKWPGDVISGSLRQKYLQFRRDNITQLVAAVSERARKVRPGLKISAAVFPDWPSARDQIGQDWKLWCEKGYLDFVCPMQYTDSTPLFEARTGQTVKWAGPKVPVMPGIGATLGLAPDGTLQQVLITRKRGAAGFVLFNYERALFDHLDLLKLGATSKAASEK